MSQLISLQMVFGVDIHVTARIIPDAQLSGYAQIIPNVEYFFVLFAFLWEWSDEMENSKKASSLSFNAAVDSGEYCVKLFSNKTCFFFLLSGFSAGDGN